MKPKKTRYQQPEKFQPTPEQDLAAMQEVAALLSENVVITSTHNPELQIRGQKKNIDHGTHNL